MFYALMPLLAVPLTSRTRLSSFKPYSLSKKKNTQGIIPAKHWDCFRNEENEHTLQCYFLHNSSSLTLSEGKNIQL